MSAEDFETFFRREFSKLVLHLRIRGFGRQTADDAAQQAMEEAFRKWASIQAPAAWVRTVALRAAGREWQRDVARPARERVYAVRSLPGDPGDPGRIAESAEEGNAVLEQLRRMPPARRKVTALTIDGYTVREIAAELGITEATVRSHLRHARRALAETAAQEEVGNAQREQRTRRHP